MRYSTSLRPARHTARAGLVLGLSFGAVAAAWAHGEKDGNGNAGDTAICQTVADAMASNAPGSFQLAQADTKPDQSSTPSNDDEKALTDELSEMLQACSYDGKALSVAARSLADGDSGSGEEVVRDIMRFTGLPQNFKVVEGDVPNAAAMIVLSKEGLPQRVIAYNAAFIGQVRTATQDNNWAPVSILAHEIGHHLSGHTLVPGGSQPPIELEADRFSGFVLFKMGAALDDAQKAVSTLVPEADGPTHPGRAKRLAAVQAGWTDSCGQQAGGPQAGSCAAPSVTVVAAAPRPVAPPPATPAEQPKHDVDIPTIADIKIPSLDGSGGDDLAQGDTGNVILNASLDRVPPLDADTAPGKFDRFVYDEVGVFDPREKDRLAKRAYAYAAATNVEIVTIVAKDLQGRSADQFALDALRQLRVGKLEVGNGAVLVVAPETGETGLALGPGLSIQYESPEALRGYLTSYLELVAGGARPAVASDLIIDASSRIMRDTKSWEWAVRFQSLSEMQRTAAAYQQSLKDTGTAYDPKVDPTWRKLVRIRATVVSTTPAKDDPALDINAPKERRIGPAMHVRTAQGEDAVLYVSPSVTALMPSPLEAGKEYAFVARDSFLAADAPQFDLISYDLLR